MLKSKVIPLLICGVFLAGCATARLPKGPDIYGLVSNPARKTIVVSKVVDDRGTTKAGMIGGTSVKVGGELVDFSTNTLMSSLNQYSNVNVSPSNISSEGSVANVVGANRADGAIIASVKSLKLHSIDSLMQPVEVNIELDVKVYDRNGSVLAHAPINGFYEKRIGLTIVDKATGELVAEAVKDAVNNLVKDSRVQSALQQI